MGELLSSNQLQTLNNNSLKCYFLAPNNLTTIVIKTINILREDSALNNSPNTQDKINTVCKLIKNMGLSLRLFCGKEATSEQR
jgi:hypothetical protein